MNFNKIKSRLYGYLPRGRDVHARELLSGGAASFLFKIIGLITGYAFTLFVTRQYGAYTMGIYALSFTILNMLSIFGKVGLDTTLVKYISDLVGRGRAQAARVAYIKAITIMVPLCMLISIGLYFLSPLIAHHIFHKEYLTPYLKMVAIALLPFSFKAINESVMRGLKRIAAFAFFQYVSMSTVSLFVLVTYVFLLGMDGDPVKALVIGAFILSGITLLYIQRSSRSLKADEPQDMGTTDILNYRAMLGYSVPLLFGSAMVFITAWTDTIMLGIMSGSVELGVYSVAMRVAPLVSIAMISLNNIAGPQIAAFYGKRDMEGMRRSIQRAAKYSFWSAVPVFAVLIIFPSFILGLFGSEFHAATLALRLLLIGQLISTATGPVGQALQMTGKQKSFQYLALVSMILNIILNALLIPRYGINGAAFASMCSIAAGNIIAVFVIKRHYGFVAMYLPLLNRFAKK